MYNYQPPVILELDELGEVVPKCEAALKPKRACKSLPSGRSYSMNKKIDSTVISTQSEITSN